jgi:hypothetical protein
MKVFVSRPTWVSPQYRPGLEAFLRILGNMNLDPRTLGATDYPRRAPLDEVITLMDVCDGVIILGYPQIGISAGFVKNSAVTGEILLPTEWNHIEGAIAYARDLPLLVIHHEGIKRGIFDRGAIGSFLYEKDLRRADWSLDTNLLGALKSWKSDCLQPRAVKRALTRPDVDSRSCPNCSSSKKEHFMSPIPAEFVALEQATHQCEKCGYKMPV